MTILSVFESVYLGAMHMAQVIWLRSKEGVNSDVLVHPSVGTILGAPKLQSVISAGGASSTARVNDPPARTAPALPPREEEEYQKICEHDEQLDDQWPTSAMRNQPPEVRGPVRGMQVWVKLPNQELLVLEIKSSTYLYDVMVESSRLSKSVTPTSDVYVTCGKRVIDPRTPLCA